jgi:intracellular sulfur oxidation DsrE/DsrF family protein
VFNVVYLLVKHYGENAKVDIVSSGPGLALLIEENLNNERVWGLAKQGVRFYAFRNTH